MVGLGMQEIFLLAVCVAIPLGVVAVVLVLMRLSKKSPADRDMDERVEREDVDDRD